MGIAIGEHRLIKEERRAGAGLLGTVLLGRTFTHTNIHTCVLYVLTHNTCVRTHTHTHAHNHYFRHQRLSAIMCYGV